MNIIQRLWFRFTHGGADIRVDNNGNAVEEVVIRYKEYFFSIMIDAETGEPTGDFAWSTDSGLHPATPIRDFYTATRPEKTVEDK